MKTYIDKEQWFTIQMWEVNMAVVSFRVYRITSMDLFETEMSYERADSKTGNDETGRLEEALIFCSGDIKFDGCCNIKFDEQETVMLHFCGNPGIFIKKLTDRLYSMAAEYMPDHIEYLLEK